MAQNAEQPEALSIIIAAGGGTRMKSRLPKVLHEIAGRPMLGHVACAAIEVGGQIAFVIAPGAPETKGFVQSTFPDAHVYYQREQLGTAHAVVAARTASNRFPAMCLCFMAMLRL